MKGIFLHKQEFVENDKTKMHTSFLLLISLYLKKKLAAICRDSGKLYPAIPGYGKASKTLNPNQDLTVTNYISMN